MAKWDTRVVSGELLEFVRALQALAPCRLAGGAVLSGVHLRHRLSKDLDLFCDTKEGTREVARRASELAAILSLLLRDFPIAPLPIMLEALTEAELARFRNELVDRFRAAALPS